MIEIDGWVYDEKDLERHNKHMYENEKNRMLGAIPEKLRKGYTWDKSKGEWVKKRVSS